MNTKVQIEGEKAKVQMEGGREGNTRKYEQAGKDEEEGPRHMMLVLAGTKIQYKFNKNTLQIQ